MLDVTPPERGFARLVPTRSRTFAALLAMFVMLVGLAACGRGGEETKQTPVKQASGPTGPPAAAAPGSQELSDEAKEIVLITRRASDRGNFNALRKALGDDYLFTGPDKKASAHLSGDQALEKWKEHQELLENLLNIADKGCLPDGTEHVVCPPEALNDAGYKGYAAGYTHQKGGDWKMTSFENRG